MSVRKVIPLARSNETGAFSFVDPVRNDCRTSYDPRCFQATQQTLKTLRHNNRCCKAIDHHHMQSKMDETEEDMLLLSTVTQASAIVSLADDNNKRKRDHRSLPRERKRVFRHQQVREILQYDYLGPKPLFNGREFDNVFRVSRSRFQCLLEDFGNSNTPFYSGSKDCFSNDVPSLEAKLLLPLKCMAFGVPPHAFMDYFSMSKTQAKDCWNNFHKICIKLHQEEYLRGPTKSDLKGTLDLHKAKHRGVDGMFGGLDCMHTHWDKCPVGWQGAFKNGSKKKPSIVLEASCDHNLWFWHASCGCAGTLNDINILNLSPLTEMFLDGSMEDLEKEVTPFVIEGEHFNKVFLLVDGIYPSFSRFVKGFKEPIGDFQKALTSWQESARKDIERAFGVLQSKFQCLARPIVLRKLETIENMVTCALILHNMCVADRVMSDCRAVYRPANNIALSTNLVVVEDSEELQELNRQRSQDASSSNIGVDNCPEEVQQLIGRKTRWMDLHNKEESARLHKALMQHLGKQYLDYKAKKKGSN